MKLGMHAGISVRVFGVVRSERGATVQFCHLQGWRSDSSWPAALSFIELFNL